jgi:hypothetical protein
VAYETVAKLLGGELLGIEAAATRWSEQKALLAQKGL